MDRYPPETRQCPSVPASRRGPWRSAPMATREAGAGQEPRSFLSNARAREAARCNVCDGGFGCPSYPCNCPCHDSEAVVAWLESPEGTAWSRSFYKAADCTLWDGVFAHLKPV